MEMNEIVGEQKIEKYL